MELNSVKQSATQALVELESVKTLESLARAELEKVQESESLAQTKCKKAQIKLESILLNLIHPFPLILSLG